MKSPVNVPLPKYAERGPIHDVAWIPLKFFHDQRGWLVELFRNDLIDPKFHPVMAYVSQTKPGVAAGRTSTSTRPITSASSGPSTFRVYLWDARKDSPTFEAKEVREVGENSPTRSSCRPGWFTHTRTSATRTGWCSTPRTASTLAG